MAQGFFTEMAPVRWDERDFGAVRGVLVVVD
jgi:hypothetical protein